MARDEQLPPPHERRLRTFWRNGPGAVGGALGAGLGAIDAVLNPGAARAQEQLRADHERVIPVPSPGDDALRRGRISLRRKDIQSDGR